MIAKMFRILLLIAFILTSQILSEGARAEATDNSVTTSEEESEQTQPSAAAKPLTPEEKEKLIVDHLNLKTDIKRCTVIDDRAVRISCYDSISETLGYLSTARFQADEEELEKFGFWQLSRKARSDGVMQTYLRLESSNRIRSRAGTDRLVTLVIRCIPGKTDVFLDWKAPVIDGFAAGRSTKTLLTYYTAPENKQTEDWEISSDKYALFSIDPVSFVRNVSNKKKLTMEFVPQGSKLEAVYFDITGVEAGIEAIVKSCY